MNRNHILKAAALKNRAFFHQRYLSPQHIPPWSQREIFDFMDEVRRKTKRGVILEPRDHLKSTTATFSYPIQLISEDETRNVRILIAQKTQKEASKTVSQIMRALKSPLMQEDFGFHFQRETGSFFMLSRENNMLKDPTVEGVGVLGSITGGHFDYIFLDDIVDVKNARTEGERAAVKDWFYSTLSFVVEPDTTIFYIGTRKHYAELVADLLANPIWMKLVRQAILVAPDNVWYEEIDGIVVPRWTGQPVVLFPEKWPIEKLLLKKREVGSVYFNREMQNTPIANEDSPLRREWLQFYRFKEENPLEIDPGMKMKVFPSLWKHRLAFIDPAIGTTERSDYFALISVVVDMENNIFVEPYDQTVGKWDFPTQTKVIMSYIDTQNPWKVGIETNFYQRSLAQHMARESLRPIIPVLHTKNKEERIIATLSPMFEAGKIFFHHDMRLLLEQYETFPKGAHDDLLDALEGVIALLLASPGASGGKMRMALV